MVLVVRSPNSIVIAPANTGTTPMSKPAVIRSISHHGSTTPGVLMAYTYLGRDSMRIHGVV